MAATWRSLRRRAHRAVLKHLRSTDSSYCLPHGSAISHDKPLLSTVYGRIIDAKRNRETANAQRISPPTIPVVSVGNYTFGATGKTPCVMFLADFILKQSSQSASQAAPRVPMLLTRGYGDDEWRMFTSRFPSCKVVVGSDRLTLGRDGVARYGSQLSCVLLEDGLQQWKIDRDLEIVMIDALSPFGNGQLIPHGSLRELPVDALARADIVLLHHANLIEDPTRLTEIFAAVSSYTDPKRDVVIGTSEMAVVALPTAVAYGEQQANGAQGDSAWDEFQGKTALIFCGVGNPESVQLVIRNMGCWSHVVIESFPDHYAFADADLRDVKDRADDLIASRNASPSDLVILTTEKDYARSAPLIRSCLEGYEVRVIVGGFKLGVGKDDVLNRVKNLLH